MDRPPDKRDLPEIDKMVGRGDTLAEIALFYRCSEDDVVFFVSSLKSDVLLRSLSENQRKREKPEPYRETG